MQADLKIKNIVLIGIFNTSVFDKYFFIKNNIVNETEILDNSSFNAIGAVQLVTKEFNILITLNQIVITDSIPENDDDKIYQIINSIVKLGSLTNITALGMNFNWLLNDLSKSFNQLSKDLFYSDNISVLSNHFNNEDSMYGSYASKIVKDSRLKLDIKPSTIQQVIPPNSLSGMIFGFNFHFDIKDRTNTDEVLNYINDYAVYKEESKKITSIYL